MNTSRLIKVLQWNLISNKREIRRSFTGLITAFCIITAANSLGSWIDHIANYGNTMTAAKLCYVATCFAMLLWASQVCFNMTTKTTFVNYAMLPATNGEKYVANVLYQTIGRIAIALAAFVVTDALQAIISLLMTGDANSLVMCGISRMQQLWSRSDFLSLALFCFFVHSTFLLGGTFFRRRQFLLTCLVWVVVPFVLSTLFALIVGGIVHMYRDGYDISITLWFSHETYEVIFTVALMVWACFNYWLSYRLFRRSQVINNKFFN